MITENEMSLDEFINEPLAVTFCIVCLENVVTWQDEVCNACKREQQIENRKLGNNE